MKKIKAKPILAFIIAVIALYVIIYVVPGVTGALRSSYIVEYGELKICDETTGYFVRNEKVYLSGDGGKTNYYIREGTMVRKGTSVMEVTGGSDSEVASKYNDIISQLGSSAVKTSNFQVQDSGIVSYYTDGFESEVNPKSMLSYSYDAFTKLNNNGIEQLNRESVAKGEPAFKVVDRTLWYIVCFIDKKNADRYGVGDSVTIEFEEGSVNADVYKVNTVDGKTRVILSTNNYYDNFAQLRSAEVKLVTSNESGLIIFNSSITKKKGVSGVYVKNKAGDYVFTPIQIISTDGEKSVITKSSYYDENGYLVDTVETYDDVLKNA